MNRLQFFLHAKTEYNLHSPFVFDLYRKVLFAQLDKDTLTMLGLHRSDRYHQLIYKLVNHLQPATLYVPTIDAVTERIASTANSHVRVSDCLEDFNSHPELAVCPSPHHDTEKERHWQHLTQLHDATTAIDLYYAGVVLFDKRLSRQTFLLR